MLNTLNRRPTSVTQSIFSSLPKAECHIHLEAGFSWERICRQWETQGRHPLPKVLYCHRDNYQFKDFNDFLLLFERYSLPWAEASYSGLVSSTLSSLVEQNIRYAEINVSLNLAKRAGLSPLAALNTIQEKLENFNKHNSFIGKIFIGLNRGDEPAVNEELVKDTINHPVVSGYDFQGDERVSNLKRHRNALYLIHKNKKVLKVHAGECVSSQSIREAIYCGAKYIGHALSAIQDPELLTQLKQKQIRLDCCPTSNLKISGVSYAQHPYLNYFRSGLFTSVSSDDPAFFGKNLTQEIETLSDYGMSLEEIAYQQKILFQTARVDSKKKEQWIKDVEDWLLNSR